MNAHNRVYPPYTFESSDEEEFPASVHEMAERSESIPHVLDVDNGFAMWMIWPTRLAPESKGLKPMFLKIWFPFSIA